MHPHEPDCDNHFTMLYTPVSKYHTVHCKYMYIKKQKMCPTIKQNSREHKRIRNNKGKDFIFSIQTNI